MRPKQVPEVSISHWLARSKILRRAHASDGSRFESIYVRHGGIATSQHNWAFRGRHHLWNLSGAPLAGSCAYRLVQQLEISQCRRFGVFVEYRVSDCTHTQPSKTVLASRCIQLRSSV